MKIPKQWIHAISQFNRSELAEPKPSVQWLKDPVRQRHENLIWFGVFIGVCVLGVISRFVLGG